MIVRIRKEVFNKFNSKFRVGLVKLEEFDNTSRLMPSKMLLKEAALIHRMTTHKDTIKTHGMINPWRAAQEDLGKKAKHYHTSVEKLVRLALKKKNLAKNSLVDNLVSYFQLKYLVPMALDDYDKIEGDVQFSLATGRERVGVLKSLKKGELYYRDEKKVLGAKLDYWKSSKTAVGKKTKTVLLHLEALPPVSVKEFNSLMQEVKRLLTNFSGGKVSSAVLHRKKNFVRI